MEEVKIMSEVDLFERCLRMIAGATGKTYKSVVRYCLLAHDSLTMPEATIIKCALIAEGLILHKEVEQ